MAMNRIQFQPGLSPPDFLKEFGAEFQCEQALAAVRWPDGFRFLDAKGSVTPFSVTARAKSSSAQAVVAKLR